MNSLWLDFLGAVQFMPRVPVPSFAHRADSLPRATKFFPLVGLLAGGSAALVHALLVPHVPRLTAALLTVTFLVFLTGCFHEDGLADAADGFGGGWTRDRVLSIMRDSRIGSYGAAAMVLSLGGRILLIASLPLQRVGVYLIAAHVLCRWTTLPLSYFLAPAREDDADRPGLGAQVARLTSPSTLLFGSLFSLFAVTALLRVQAIPAVIAALCITLLSGLYYCRRIQGVTGDCFGATNQITEIFVYVCGVWTA